MENHSRTSKDYQKGGLMTVIVDTKLLAYGRTNIIQVIDVIVRTIQRARQQFPFDDFLRVICCTDVGKSSYRLNLHKGYKSGRFYGDPEEAKRFRRDYTDGLIPILHHFGFTVLDIEGLEADDQASILLHSVLPEEEVKVIITEDRDWLGAVLEVPNTYWLSPRTFQVSNREQTISTVEVANKAQFIAKKCILGDSGDSIKPAATLCGAVCYESFKELVFSQPEATEGTFWEQLDFIKGKYLEFVSKNPKHKVHKDYLCEVKTIKEAWDLNVKLGMTMVDFEHLTKLQHKLLAFKLTFIPKLSLFETINHEIKRLVPHQENPFGGHITMPIELYESIVELYELHPDTLMLPKGD